MTNDTSDGGTPPPTSSRPLLESGTVRLEELRERAREYPGVHPAAAFVTSEVRPDPGARQRIAGQPADGRLTYGQLMVFALEWDHDGLTPLRDFLDALECEMVGTRRSAVVTEAMIEIGFEAVYHRRLEESAA